VRRGAREAVLLAAIFLAYLFFGVVFRIEPLWKQVLVAVIGTALARVAVWLAG
jgi:hypothetical protein